MKRVYNSLHALENNKALDPLSNHKVSYERKLQIEEGLEDDELQGIDPHAYEKRMKRRAFEEGQASRDVAKRYKEGQKMALAHSKKTAGFKAWRQETVAQEKKKAAEEQAQERKRLLVQLKAAKGRAK
eukprot:NODE_2551_length_904_cov_79.871345_g2096_i0.p2 GENE.NODE_2551_length_904_cov_79.871345_g2096_i0~~NODE_2551_length_904_cov_79.871345_g2096_i0.p2  ORF type:complete len:128 (-),score=39.22 NODE_2551_length_904_cov_79.871345_g2096_i0:29-412(-)